MWKIILLLLFMITVIVGLVISTHKPAPKEPFSGSTLGPWGYHYMPSEFIFPNYEYAYQDAKYAYFFDEIGDMWKTDLPAGPNSVLRHA